MPGFAISHAPRLNAEIIIQPGNIFATEKKETENINERLNKKASEEFKNLNKNLSTDILRHIFCKSNGSELETRVGSSMIGVLHPKVDPRPAQVKNSNLSSRHIFVKAEVKNTSLDGDKIDSGAIEEFKYNGKSDTKHIESAVEVTKEWDIHPQNQLISCGSCSLTSDNDYTFLGNRDRALLAGGAKLKNSHLKEKLLEGTIECYRDLLATIRPDFTVREMDADATSQHIRTLTPEQKTNAINALAKADFNWFKALELYAGTHPQIVWDIRSLEVEITQQIKGAIENTYYNLSESDMVTKSNHAMRAIFGKETGTLFDTNYYTAHAILQKGFNFSDSKLEEKWLQSNQVQSLVKVASHYRSNFKEKERFDAFCRASGFNPSLSNQAWSKMKIRNNAIKQQSHLVKQSAMKEIERLKNELSSNESSSKINYIKNKIKSLETKLQNSEEIEIEAMNNLYMTGLELTEEHMNRYVETKNNFNEKLEAFANSVDKASKEPFKQAILQGDFSKAKEIMEKSGMLNCEVKLAVLRTLKRDIERTGNDVIDVQMTTLLFANEPYYSQASVVAIVAGMQMKKSANEYPLLKNQKVYRMCMTENFGDFTKDRHHYHNEPEKFAYRGSKYLSRTMESAKKSLNINGSRPELTREIETLSNISNSLLSIRKSSANDSQKMSQAVDTIKSGMPELAGLSNKAMMDALFARAEKVVMTVNSLG